MEIKEKVYELLRSIPKGKVVTYGQIGTCLGNKNLSRVIGNILHRNPEPITTPCHRVVNARGEVAANFGFGGGEVQRRLLEEEGIVFEPNGRIDLRKYGTILNNLYCEESMKEYVLEACVDSTESALIATKAGADRLELCGNLMIGGTTPSIALYKQIRKTCKNRIHVLIRPRFGDFCYTENEIDIMCEEIRMFKELGADGVVIGALAPDGSVNWNDMDKMIAAADGMWVTMHRAFDMCKDPYKELEACISHGVSCILTSGQENHCLDGVECLKKLIEAAEDKIQILVGSGVDAKVIAEVYEKTKAKAYHMSGKEVLDSQMVYRKEHVYMGLDGLSEYSIWRTKKENIEAAVSVLRKL